MTRMLSAAMLKGKRSRGQSVPRPGSHIRAIYDRFKAAPGAPIHATLDQLAPGCSTGQTAAVIEALRNTYGLDIRKLHNGCWCLVGEWDGRVYIDHVAARLAGRP